MNVEEAARHVLAAWDADAILENEIGGRLAMNELRTALAASPSSRTPDAGVPFAFVSRHPEGGELTILPPECYIPEGWEPVYKHPAPSIAQDAVYQLHYNGHGWVDATEAAYNEQSSSRPNRVLYTHPPDADAVRRESFNAGVAFALRIIDGGSFLHRDAPPARFAREVSSAIKRELPRGLDAFLATRQEPPHDR